MAVSELKFYAGGEKIFREYPILNSNYMWILVQSSYIPSQAHSLYDDISGDICETAGYAHVDATGAAFVNTYDPDFANPAFVTGAEGKYVVLCIKAQGVPYKLVGFYDVEVGLNTNVKFNSAFNINAGGVLDYNIEGWSYGGGGGGGGGGNEPPPSGAVTEVIVTQTARAAAPSSYPLNFCVPYAKGVLANNSTFALYDSSDVKKAAQFDAFERWEDTSIKMLHVCTDTFYTANTARTFKLKSGDSQNFAAAATVTQASGVTTVSFNGNNYVTNDNAFTFFNGWSVYMLNAKDNLKYTSLFAATTSIVENGEVRVVLKSTGVIKNGSTVLFNFILRQYFYPLSSALEIELTVFNTNPEGAFAYDYAASAGIGNALRISVQEYGFEKTGNFNRLFAAGSSTDHDQTSSSDLNFKQNGSITKTGGTNSPYTFSYSGIGTGGKAKGAFKFFETSGAQYNMCWKRMWKEYPQAIQVGQTGAKIKFHFTDSTPSTVWPSMVGSNLYIFPNTFFSTGYGVAKTHNLLFILGSVTDAELKAKNEIFQEEYLTARASLDYIRSTKVFGDYLLSSAATAAYDTRFQSNFDIGFWNEISGTQVTKNQVMYGWNRFGNRRHTSQEQAVLNSQALCDGLYNGSHFGCDKQILQYLRTGLDKYYYFAAVESHCFADLHICHAPRKGQTNYTVSGTFTDIDFPAGECLASSHDNLDCYTRNMQMNHLHNSSLHTIWLMEKKYWYKEVSQKVMVWIKTMFDNWLPATGYAVTYTSSPQTRPFAEAEREWGNPLLVACNFAHTFNDKQFFEDVAVKIVNFLVRWVKTTRDHRVNNVVVGTHDFSQGTGYWSMDGNGNYAHNRDSGCNPWMAGHLLNSLADFRDLSIRFNVAFNPDFYEMIRQCITYIMQWGRDGSGAWVYVEGKPDKDTLYDALAYGLMYWGIYFNNSAWQAEGLKVHNFTLGRVAQATYGYGYEEIYKPGQFKLFNT